MWASSGPFPLSAHYGLYKRGRDPPTNPSRHLKKERSPLPLKWLLKEDQGRRPTTASVAATAAAQPRVAAVPAAETAASPCFGHVLPTHSTLRRRCRRRCRRLRPPPPLSESCATLPSSTDIPHPRLATIRAAGNFPADFPATNLSRSHVPSIPRSNASPERPIIPQLPILLLLPPVNPFPSLLPVHGSTPPSPHCPFFSKSHPHTALILSPLQPSCYPTLQLPLLPLPLRPPSLSLN